MVWYDGGVVWCGMIVVVVWCDGGGGMVWCGVVVEVQRNSFLISFCRVFTSNLN